ncbi:MAG: hypothetical protein JWR84_1870 [Caulobacter sp.]|nr:hypothetical protein [Caulobacter sp.]
MKAADELEALIALIEATAWPPAFRPTPPYPAAFQGELFAIAVEADAWVEQERTRAFLSAGGRVTEGLDHAALVAAMGGPIAYRVFDGLYAVSTGRASGPYGRFRALLQQRNWLNRRFGQRGAD